MPSLKALGEFAASLKKIGGEDRIQIDRNLPPDESPLPEQEAVEPDELSLDDLFDADTITDGEFSDDAFSSFDDDDSTGGDSAAGELADGTSADDLLNFGDLGDLLGGFTETSDAPSDDVPFDDTPGDVSDGDLQAETPVGDNVSTSANSDDAPFADLQDFDEAAPQDEPADISDLTDLLDSLPDDFGQSEAGETPPDLTDGIPEDLPAGETPGDDFTTPPDLLDGLTETLDLTPDSERIPGLEDSDDVTVDFPDSETTAESEDAETVINLDELPDFGEPDETAETVFNLDDLPDFGEPDETAETVFNLDDLPDFGEPDEATETPAEPGDVEAALDLDGLPDFLDAAETAETPTEPEEAETAFNLNELPDFPFLDEAPPDTDTVEEALPVEDLDMNPEADLLADFPEVSDSIESEDSMESDADGFDMGGEYAEEVSPSETDPFEQFNLTGRPETNSEPGQDGGQNQTDEFNLPGLDDILGQKDSGGGDELLGEPEEIRLSDEEAARLRETLASYPLNLRIACGELIAEEIVAPDLMASLIKLLVNGAPPKETAALAGKILNRAIPIPKGFEKKTGADLETEQASFSYIFVHKFLPVLRTFMMAALVALSLGYLVWNFVYLPMRAESIYRRGHELIPEGEYGRSRDLFREAFAIHQNKDWFYRYAESYRDERQYILAEEKYDELLNYTASKNKRGIPEKQAVLDYAAMETNYLRNYSKADTLLRRYILDFSIWDKEALLALGDNSLAWGDIEKERYEDAREAYAKLLEHYGSSDPVMERMLKYFMRTDKLGDVLPLQNYFMASEKRVISADTLAELGGYLMDKRTEEIRGVPNEYLEMIDGIRDVLLRAVREDPVLPEAYYHLARYYRYMNNQRDEELTLARAVQAFDAAELETPRRVGYRVEALRRYGEIHVQRGEFFRGEDYLVDAARIYEDGLSRRLLAADPKYGRLYADLGDLEYFVKEGNAAAALAQYTRAEQNGYAPPEILYRMGGSHYQLGQWQQALERFTSAAFPQPFNRRILYALGNASYMRGNYFAAQGYYDRLIELLESDMTRFPLITPGDDPGQRELAERLMVVQNNLGVTLEALTQRTGDSGYRARALGLYAESERAWDVLTRNPDSMVRLRPAPDIAAPGVNPAYLNVQNSLYPIQGYEPIFFLRIDRDIGEPSIWETIAPPAFTLSEGVASGR